MTGPGADRAALGLVGAGLIGRRHAEAARISARGRIAAVADPAPGAQRIAAAHGARWFPDLDAMLAAGGLAAGGLEGVILATPTGLHESGAMACLAAGLPVLVEKPICADAAAAARLVAAAEQAAIPLSIGHHRRCNPLIAQAKSLIDAGRLGRIASVQATCWLRKHDAYFAPDWRRAPGAGPVLTNLIHDVDLLLHLCGPVVSVAAMTSSAMRGHAVEDGAVILLRFESGALGTVSVSDAAAAPWSWELTAAENPAYPATDRSCYLIGGTEGSLSLPDLSLWRHSGPEGWWSPIAAERFPAGRDDPLPIQIDRFVASFRDGAAPACSGAEGLAALRVLEAALHAAAAGGEVTL